MAECVLALDVGTTGARALLVDRQGAVLARSYQRLAVRTPRPGWVEQDPEELARVSLTLLPQVLAQAGRSASDVAAIGVVSQRSTALAWDRETGRPLAPAIGWQDQRTAERVAGFRAQGLPLNTLASATKFEWWLRHDPAVKRAQESGRLCLGTPDSWLTWVLTAGRAHVTDPGHASCTALFDLASQTWSEPLLALFGVDLRSMPKLEATSAVVGETPPKLLGSPVAVAARAGDQQAAAFAQGVHREGQSKLTLGTSAMLDQHCGHTPPDFADGSYPLALWRLSQGSP
ncbi:MAG: FGGY family carbohydrate kinase, partial [Myxococcota bacterium]